MNTIQSEPILTSRQHRLGLSIAIAAALLTIFSLSFNHSASAQAEPDASSFTLTLTSSPGGSATVFPEGTSFAPGTVITLTATADAGWVFYRWQGTVDPSVNQENPLPLTMNMNHQISASFIRKTYTLSTASDGNGLGGVYVTPDLPFYNHGDSISLRAVPDPASKFEYWRGDINSTNAEETLIISNNSVVTATFSLLPVTLDLFKIGSGDGQVSADPPGPLYEVGDIITVTAVPDELSALTTWDGAISGNDLTETFTITENSEITATFDRIRYLLDVDLTGGGDVTKLPNQPNYLADETVSVTATPDVGWRFVDWQGDLSGQAASLDITMNRDITSTAVFTQIIYSIETATIGMGSVVLNPNQPGYTYGNKVTATAVADPGWLFKEWQGDLSGDEASRNLTITDNLQITAEFERIYTLDVVQIGQGTVITNPNNPYYFPGDTIQMSAEPKPGWVFIGWSGDIDSSNTQISFKINKDLSITATFKELFSLDVQKVGNGSVVVTPEQPLYLDGKTVKLRAFPDPGWSFAGWRDDVEEGNATVSVVIDKNMKVTARFAQDIYDLKLFADGNGTVTTDPPGPFVYDEVVALIAVSAWNWKFLGWSQSMEYDPDQILSHDTVVIVSVTQDDTYVAHFVALPWTIFLPQIQR